MRLKNYLTEAFDLTVYKKVLNSLKDQVKKARSGNRMGSWILEVVKDDKDLEKLPIEVSWKDGGLKHKRFKNLKAAVQEFPDLDEFMGGMRGADGAIRFESASSYKHHSID